MRLRTKSALIAVVLCLCAGFCFAAEAPVPGLAVKAAAKSTDGKTAATAKTVDINTATAAELKAIPGIGDAYSEKIIAGRPYANKAQLKSRNILPTNVYEQVKDMIIAKAVKK
jgi:DNA uptake protein ComE-like DNA-binding protein